MQTSIDRVVTSITLIKFHTDDDTKPLLEHCGSSKDTKYDCKNTPKCTRPNCILVPGYHPIRRPCRFGLVIMMMMTARASLSSPVILRVGHFPGAEKPLTENHLSLPFTPSNPPSICFCHTSYFHNSHLTFHISYLTLSGFSYFHISHFHACFLTSFFSSSKPTVLDLMPSHFSRATYIS